MTLPLRKSWARFPTETRMVELDQAMTRRRQSRRVSPHVAPPK